MSINILFSNVYYTLNNNKCDKSIDILNIILTRIQDIFAFKVNLEENITDC